MKNTANNGGAVTRPAKMSTKIEELIGRADYRELLDVLDCDAYTAAQDWRALEGLGWLPCRLTPPERMAIHAALEAGEVAP